MLNFVIRRLLQIPLVMLAVSMVIVGLTMFLTPVQRAAGYVTSEQQAARIDEIIKERGLDQPFLVQYWNWLESALKFDFGFAKSASQPVTVAIAERLPNTLELGTLAFIPIITLGIWLGTLAALKKDKLADQIIRVFVVIAYSLPSFVLGIVLLAVFYGYLQWAPGPGQMNTENTLLYNQLIAAGKFHKYTGLTGLDSILNGQWAIAKDVYSHLILPVTSLSLIITAQIVKLMRTSMLESLTSDYVRTARSKGLSEAAVNKKHARRNALMPIINAGGFTLLGLITGSMITESIFGYPGIGLFFLTAARQLDLPAVLGLALLMAFMVVVARTLIDIGFAAADPRVRFD